MVLAMLAVVGVLTACATRGDVSVGLVQISRGLSDQAFARLTADMDPAMMALAQRHDGVPSLDLWGRPIGWASYSLDSAPTLGFGFREGLDAQRLNALLPGLRGLPSPAPPFVLETVGAERDRGIFCLTQAIYYEAARESQEGREAVAQVVLNRMRHPAYPKTICGVVYQGAERVTGCQFSFTCDGSVRNAPMLNYWNEAKAIAQKAVAGFVQKNVGTATFYHADYVFPVWAPTLFKVRQIGAHIFYRFPGLNGQPQTLNGRHAGNELTVSLEVRRIPDAQAPIPPGLEMLANEGPPAPPPVSRVLGMRAQTAEDIRRVNERLARLAGELPAETEAEKAAAAKPATPGATVPAVRRPLPPSLTLPDEPSYVTDIPIGKR